MVSQKRSLASRTIDLAERGALPDVFIRMGIRRLLRQRLGELRGLAQGDARAYTSQFASRLDGFPVAESTDKANEQHYELPPEFFQTVLGHRLKYSSCYWPEEVRELDAAETEMLGLTCERAELEDGMEILELGCGWGSLTLWMAEHYPLAKITALTNSSSQADFIRERAAKLGRNNVKIEKSDINDFNTSQRFDRVVSVEMFEHARNYRELLSRVATWLNPRGKLFIHVFAHRETPYLFEAEGDTNWMGRFFFSGGTMPSHGLFQHFDEDLAVEKSWWVNGKHYAETLESWLRKLDARRAVVEPVMARTYGPEEAERWLQRWRIFFLACAELFAFRDGQEWGVSHLRFVANHHGVQD